MKNDEKQVLLDVKNLKKYFNVGNKKILKASLGSMELSCIVTD